MSLIHCNECGKEYSDASNICIHCGYPTSINTGGTEVTANKQIPEEHVYDQRKKISLLIRFLSVLFLIRIVLLSSLVNIANEVMDEYGRPGIIDPTYFFNHPSYDMVMTSFKLVFIGCCILFSTVAYLSYRSDLANKKIYNIICIIMAGQYLLTIIGVNNVFGPATAFILIHTIIAAAAILILKYEEGRRTRIEMIIVLSFILIATFFATLDYSISIAPVMGFRDSFNVEIMIVIFYIIIANLFASSAKRFKLCNSSQTQLKED